MEVRGKKRVKLNKWRPSSEGEKFIRLQENTKEKKVERKKEPVTK